MLDGWWFFDNRETKTLDVTELYDAQWVSDNLKSLAVYKGKITALEKGKAKIKVRYFGKLKELKIEVQD